MPKLEIPDVPDQLYRQIEESARRKGVPLGQEAAELLAKGAADDEAREAQLLAETRRDRESLDLYLTDADISEAKREGAA
jgi:hypothetical protein